MMNHHSCELFIDDSEVQIVATSTRFLMTRRDEHAHENEIEPSIARA